MGSHSRTQLPKVLLKELDPCARKVARMACHAYEDQSEKEKETYRQIRSEFEQQKRTAKRAVRALKKLRKGLEKWDVTIKGTPQGDIESLANILREAHIPKGSPVLLPIYGKNLSLSDYYKIQNIEDPASSLSKFIEAYPTIRRFCDKESRFLQAWIKKRTRPKKRRIAVFSVPGALQYALKSLFRTRVIGRRWRINKIHRRIRDILVALDGGGAASTKKREIPREFIKPSEGSNAKSDGARRSNCATSFSDIG